MPKCPKCGENIETLIAWIPKEDRCEVSLNPDNTLRYEFDENIAGKGTTEYECPLCSEIISRSESDVEKFLKGEERNG